MYWGGGGEEGGTGTWETNDRWVRTWGTNNWGLDLGEQMTEDLKPSELHVYNNRGMISRIREVNNRGRRTKAICEGRIKALKVHSRRASLTTKYLEFEMF